MRISDDRIQHMHNVAEYMYEHAKDYGLENQKEQMYFLGLIHDIGSVRSRETHEHDGADILRMTGLSQRYLTAVEWHGSSPLEYCKYHGITEEQLPNFMLLLWEADLHIGTHGEYMSFDDRLADIKSRRGEEKSKVAEDVLRILRQRGRV